MVSLGGGAGPPGGAVHLGLLVLYTTTPSTDLHLFKC